jgi:hypothetical protein
MTDDARLQAAATAGLDEALADRLQGDTPEELAADAATLAALTRQPEQTNTLAKQIAQAEQAGDWQKAMSLKGEQLAQLHRDDDRANAARSPLEIGRSPSPAFGQASRHEVCGLRH